MRLLAASVAAAMLLSGCGAGEGAAETAAGIVTAASVEAEMEKETEAEDFAADAVASPEETAAMREVVQEGMTPVYGDELKDGTYPIQAESSSDMFKITECLLTVQDKKMSAVMTMGGTGYLKVYMGTGEEAAKASEEDYIPFEELADGTHIFEIPVEALDKGIECSAFSKRKEKWYDRTLIFRAQSLPMEAFAADMVTAAELSLEDGRYTAEVTLEGGSGRAKVESPAVLRVENGSVYATIVWGSANYDYMKVDGVQYDWNGTEGNSTFEIPVACFDRKLEVAANTTAMSTPHEVEYTLQFDSSTLARAEES